MAPTRTATLTTRHLKFSSGLTVNVISFVIALLVATVVFLSAITIPYAHHDQYRHFIEPGPDKAFKQNCGHDPQYFWLRALGRPIAAYSECLIFEHTTRLSDLTEFRYAVIVLLALTIAVYAAALRDQGLGAWPSVALSLSVFTLPGAQNAVFMTNFANVLAPLAAIVSHTLLDRAESSYVARGPWKACAFAGLAGALLLISLFTYPFLALFFFCLTLTGVLFRVHLGWRSHACLLVRDALVFGAAAGLYWLAAKFVFFPTDPAIVAHMPGGYHATLDFSGAIAKSSALIDLILPRILTLWSIYPSKVLSYSIGAIIACGLIVYLLPAISDSGIQSGPTRLVTVAAIPGLLLAADAPFLLTPAFFLFRIFFVSAAMLVILLFWGGIQITIRAGLAQCLHDLRWQIRLALPIAIAAGIIAAVQTTRNALNSYAELSYIKTQITAARGQRVDRIHIIRPKPGLGFNGSSAITDEFNVPTTTFSFDIANLVRLALVEMGAQTRYVVDGDTWMTAARTRPPCVIKLHGNSEFIVRNERGATAEAFFQGNRLDVPSWGISGAIGKDDANIRWSNGELWARVIAPYPLDGTWTVTGVTGRHNPGGRLSSLSEASITGAAGQRWLLTNERGDESEATLTGTVLQPSAWSVTGLVEKDGSEIHWSNGSTWSRSTGRASENALDGPWTKFDRYKDQEVLVTSSSPSEPIFRSPNTLVIDMNVLLDSVGVGHRAATH